jgi:DNA-binding NtrC family response regulator
MRRLTHILLVDNDASNIDFLRGALGKHGLEVHAAVSGSEALQLLEQEQPELVIQDVQVPDGWELLNWILDKRPGMKVVILTKDDSPESVVRAMRCGALDYLIKPLGLDQLTLSVDRWLIASDISNKQNELPEDLIRELDSLGIVGRSQEMVDLFRKVHKLAPFFQVALVTGETGTGKEGVAHLLHRLSPVANGPFVVANCAAITETLFESEVFGHMRGSFTGASANRTGLAEAADGGTLFLDEIGELPLQSQAKLLRLMQTGEVRPVGSTLTRKVHLRVIAATNRNPREMVRQQIFREDLYYRLATLELRLPPLARRNEDLDLLIKHFLDKIEGQMGRSLRLTPTARHLLQRYAWPGNVREMENTLSYASMLASEGWIDLEHLPTWLTNAEEGPKGDLLSLNAVITRHADTVLQSVNGNRLKAAKILGIGRATLYRILARNPKLLQ